MTDIDHSALPPHTSEDKRDMLFALGIVMMLVVLFLPIPPMVIDLGLTVSIALSVLILMVALWIQKPLEFSAFPSVLLIATMLRLSLNVASTRLILSNGSEGYNAAGNVIGGFSRFVMSGDFVIGVVVFVILITVNFLVITKGATRIAEVGARFTLDAIPGKQMAIDADLSAGLVNEKQAQERRRELEEESSFFGSMDGASKFVRGDAIAGLIITIVNIVGGIIIGVTRHGMEMAEAADVFTKLSVGDGLVSQIPALIVSLAAGLLVSKGGNRGSVDKAVLSQLARYPRALAIAAVLMGAMALTPGLPAMPFLLLGTVMAVTAYVIPKRLAKQQRAEQERSEQLADEAEQETKNSVKELLKTAEIELCLGKQLSAVYMASHTELAHRVAKMRRKFAQQLGFIVPEIRLGDDLALDSKEYEIRMHGTAAASGRLRLGDVMVITGDGPKPNVPGEETFEPAFGMKGVWVSEHFTAELERQNFKAVDNLSIMLTHLSEVVRSNLAQLLSYKDLRILIDRLEPEYQRLIDEIVPANLTYSGIQAVLKLLLSERVSIRNLSLILEAISEVAPHLRRPEQIVEHVRARLAQQICGDIATAQKLKILRLGNRWDMAFHQSLKRDAKGEIIEFDIEPKLIEDFNNEASALIRKHMDAGTRFALITMPETRPFVRMICERLFPNLPVLSHAELARGIEIETLGSIS